MRTTRNPMEDPLRARPRTALLVAVLMVAAVACGGEPADEPAAPAGEATGAAGGPATFVAVDIAYEQAPASLAPGRHTFELVNDGATRHTVTIEELGDRDVVEADGGQTATGDVELDAGSYTYYCSVPGHREAGMEGTLDVS